MFSLIPLKRIEDVFSFVFVDEDRPAVANLTASYYYQHDPLHKKNPGAGWVKTEKGWSKGDSGQEITFSPEVNIPKQDAKKTEENVTNKKSIIESVIKSVVGKPLEYSISTKKEGRYFENGVLYKESSYSFDLKGASRGQSFKIAQALADKMSQSSVLVWDNESRTGHVVDSTSVVEEKKKKGETPDLHFDNKSVEFSFTGKSGAKNLDKIDSIVRGVMADSRGNELPSGWTVSENPVKDVFIAGKRTFIPVSHSVVMHGLEESEVHALADKMVREFKKSVVVYDHSVGQEKVFEYIRKK